MDKYLQIIASASLFRGIAKTEIAAVLQNLDAQLRVYPRNSFIWQLGEQVTTAGFVVAGSVHILREDYWGRQNILAQLGCGHLFGEVYACLRQGPLTVSVAAPPYFPQGSSCLVVLRILLSQLCFHVRGFHPLRPAFPKPFC